MKMTQKQRFESETVVLTPA